VGALPVSARKVIQVTIRRTVQSEGVARFGSARRTSRRRGQRENLVMGSLLAEEPGTGLHSAASAGFARSVAAYERGRPGYPPAAVDFLAARLRLGPGRTVVDLAAGTGKLTRPLLAAGADLVAVEPVAEMRAALPAGARAVEGTAEAIPLATASADAVTVAQAFHWFDGDAALAEIHRVLRPGGALALVWNRRQMDDPLNQAIEELIAPHRGHTSALRTGAWRGAFERTKLFGPLEERVFPNEQSLDADELVDRIASVSFIAALDEKERTKLLRAARALPGAAGVTIRQDTEVQLADRLG
jgi:SAM-dependent methyltransferase